MLFYFFIYMLTGRGKKERFDNYKMEVVIRKVERNSYEKS